MFNFFNPYGYQGITDGSRLIASAMIVLAIIGVFATLTIKPYLMLGISVLSCVPMGCYLLGTPGLFRWIGIGNGLFLLSSLMMFIALRLPNPAAGRRPL
jgi:hypothetical protein